MSKDIDLRKINDLCRAYSCPGRFYTDMQRSNVAIPTSALPIYAPVIRGLCITALQTLKADEVKRLLSEIIPTIPLNSMPLDSIESWKCKIQGQFTSPRVWAFIAVKLFGSTADLYALPANEDELDFSKSKCKILEEMKAISNLIIKPITFGVEANSNPLAEGAAPAQSTTPQETICRLEQEVTALGSQRRAAFEQLGAQNEREIGLARQLDTAEAKVQRLQHRLQQQDGIIRKLSNAIIDQSTIHSQLKMLDVELLQSRNTIKRLNDVYASLGGTQQKRICTDTNGADAR